MSSVKETHRAAALLDHITHWSEHAMKSGFIDFLSPKDSFRMCALSRKPWANRKQPGIYSWLADDGEAYVGKSVVPQARLRQHVRDHGDPVEACFLPCAEPDLDRLEQELISKLGPHFHLRNIKHAVSTVSDVPFDELVNATERESFLAGEDLNGSAWKTFDELTRLKAVKFEKFLARDGGPEALAAARFFIRRAIPKPAATEAFFWSVSIFPSSCFIRINAGQQEIFTAEGRFRGCDVRILTDKRISLWRSSKTPYRVPCYETGISASALDKWLAGSALQSCRRLVVRLMRHTTALNSGSHCPQVARLVANTRTRARRPT